MTNHKDFSGRGNKDFEPSKCNEDYSLLLLELQCLSVCSRVVTVNSREIAQIILLFHQSEVYKFGAISSPSVLENNPEKAYGAGSVVLKAKPGTRKVLSSTRDLPCRQVLLQKKWAGKGRRGEIKFSSIPTKIFYK